MIDFASVQGIEIPDGVVVQITALDGTVLWKRAGLPVAYQQVEYIQSDGNQYFDTLVNASHYPEGIRYVFRGCVTAYQTTANIYWFGALANGCRSGNIATINDTITLIVGGDGNGAGSLGRPSVGVDFELVLQCTSKSVADFIATLNGTQFSPTGLATNSEMPDATIYFLTARGTSAASTANRKFCGKIYSFTMDSIDGTSIRNFVPCYRKSDGVIGLYDTVGAVFYTDIGTGSFTKGADV